MNGHYSNCFMPRALTQGYPGYEMNFIKQKMLEHEAIFKNQVHELHRVYKVQEDMMDKLKNKELHIYGRPAEASVSSNLLTSHMPSEEFQKAQISSFPSMNSMGVRPAITISEDGFSFLNSNLGKSVNLRIETFQIGDSSKVCEIIEVRPTKVRRKVFDLELPADEYIDTEEMESLGDKKVPKNSLADLNEPFEEGNNFSPLDTRGKASCQSESGEQDLCAMKSSFLSLFNGTIVRKDNGSDWISSLLKSENDVVETEEMSVLDLPELVLELILEKLQPEGLCNMASVCSSLRDRCSSDYFWERHMKQKWGRIIGTVAYREWQWNMATRNDSGSHKRCNQKGLMRSLTRLLPSFRAWTKVDESNKQRDSLPVDSILSWYLALESGKFCFPAQVYNRENGHVGFMLSCYDAELSYDSRSDTFQAKYPPHGRRAIAIENGVSWERLRAPPVDTPPHDLHISDCLNDLCPGDHIEIQWRRNKKFPYGWWYGIVGHLESCDGNEIYCHCSNSDTVALEFNQYPPGSWWRQTIISRKDHREEGNETDGFYGGIRKLYSNEEISTWKRLWPSEVLE